MSPTPKLGGGPPRKCMMPVTIKQIDRLAATAAELLALEKFQFWGSSLRPLIFWDPRRRQVVGDRGGNKCTQNEEI